MRINDDATDDDDPTTRRNEAINKIMKRRNQFRMAKVTYEQYNSHVRFPRLTDDEQSMVDWYHKSKIRREYLKWVWRKILQLLHI